MEVNSKMSVKGFMNYHAHLDKGNLIPPNVYQDAPVAQRAEWTRQLKAEFTIEDIKNRASQILDVMSSYGTTYVRTHVDVDSLVGLKGIEALLQIQEKYRDRIVIDLVAFAQEGFDRFPETETLLREAMSMGVKSIGGHTTADQAGKKHIDRIFEIAEREQVELIEFHTDEPGKAEHFLQPYLAEVTMKRGWQNRVTAIHCNSLAMVEEDEARRVAEMTAEAGMMVTICPTAIATRSLTRAKMLSEAGVKLQLGSDNVRDYFNPFGSGNMLHYAQLFSYILRYYQPDEMAEIFAALTTPPKHLGAEERLNQLTGSYLFPVSSIHDLFTYVPKPIHLSAKELKILG